MARTASTENFARGAKLRLARIISAIEPQTHSASTLTGTAAGTLKMSSARNDVAAVRVVPAPEPFATSRGVILSYRARSRRGWRWTVLRRAAADRKSTLGLRARGEETDLDHSKVDISGIGGVHGLWMWRAASSPIFRAATEGGIELGARPTAI